MWETTVESNNSGIHLVYKGDMPLVWVKVHASLCCALLSVKKMEALVRLHFVTQEQNTGQHDWLETEWTDMKWAQYEQMHYY